MIAGDAKTRSFALKQMKKSQIVETRQQQHIMSGIVMMMTMAMTIFDDHRSDDDGGDDGGVGDGDRVDDINDHDYVETRQQQRIMSSLKFI